MIIKKLFIILISVVATKLYAQYPKVDIPGSEVRKLTSSIVKGQEYELQISLPAGYATSNKYYPVLYLQDAQWDFPLLKSLYGQQYYDGFIPEMIIVGITWGGVNPNPDSLRVRDYTPANDGRQVQSGGAYKYLSFLKNELIPFIEKNYRADITDRTLMGCSLGGLFTLYTLFVEPGIFQRYVAASPAIGWDNEILYHYEQNYFQSKSTSPSRLYLCVGGVERSVPGFQKLVKFLSDRKYPSLKFQSMVLENTGHSGTKGEGFARGLQFVFERPKLKLSEQLLNKYTGVYNVSGNKIEIKNENGNLNLYFSPATKYLLYAADETDFYSISEFLKIYFKTTDEGKVEGFQLDRYAGSQFFTKEK